MKGINKGKRFNAQPLKRHKNLRRPVRLLDRWRRLNIARRNDVQAIVLVTPLWVILRPDVALMSCGELEGEQRDSQNDEQSGGICASLDGSRLMAAQRKPRSIADVVVLLSARIGD